MEKVKPMDIIEPAQLAPLFNTQKSQLVRRAIRLLSMLKRRWNTDSMPQWSQVLGCLKRLRFLRELVWK